MAGGPVRLDADGSLSRSVNDDMLLNIRADECGFVGDI